MRLLDAVELIQADTLQKSFKTLVCSVAREVSPEHGHLDLNKARLELAPMLIRLLAYANLGISISLSRMVYQVVNHVLGAEDCLRLETWNVIRRAGWTGKGRLR